MSQYMNLKYEKFRVSKSGMYLDEHQIVDYMLSIDADLKAGYELLNEYRNYNSQELETRNY